MEAQIGTAIIAVKILTDVAKTFIRQMSGRKTQWLVFALSVIAGGLITRLSDPQAFIASIGVIFAGAVAADQVIKKEI